MQAGNGTAENIPNDLSIYEHGLQMTVVHDGNVA